jgi:hypothetical protein
MRFLLICLGLLCTSSWGTEPLKQTRDDASFTLVMEVVPASKITARCKLLGAGEGRNACTIFNLETKVCMIYVSPQRFQFDDERLALIGHEVWHCRFGVWHDPE